jgi:hypothetical protein
MAAAAIRGLQHRFISGEGYAARLSLARTARLLVDGSGEPRDGTAMGPGTLAAETPDDLADATEATFWGPAQRIKPPAIVEGAPMRWDIAAAPLGSSPATW